MLFVLSAPFILFYVMRLLLSYRKNSVKHNNSFNVTVGFFHPYCNAGGGGERVLWTAVRAVQTRYKHALCVVYTGDEVSEKEILDKVKNRFNITFSRQIKFVFLKRRMWVEAKMYPYFTLLGQSLGSIILGFEALMKYVPDIYIDTMGYAFTLPIFKYLGCCETGCYVHYPTISTDMLGAVREQKEAVNNRRFISNSRLLSLLKIIYYKAFALLYGFMGRRANVVMVNSSWTREHILSLWKKPLKTCLVYPPCDVSEFQNLPLPVSNSRILSIAQFRPEKNHKLQINAFHKLLSRLPEHKRIEVKLVVVGSCRDEEDFALVERLKALRRKLEMCDNVEFKVNLSFQELLSEMKNAGIALHSMWNEHFGIGVVECMSAGLIMIAHDSGGPKQDIVVEYNGKRTGFLANDTNSYADSMEFVMKMSTEEQTELRRNARDSVKRFSAANFEELFLSATRELFI